MELAWASGMPGLSPHERGNLGLADEARLCLGTIPARAGEPRIGPEIFGTAGDYPRTSGGTLVEFTCQQFDMGLSPHERGNHAPSSSATCRRRTIPARAGEPRPRSARTASTWDYPRTSGGTRKALGRLERLGGLSPHERGNQEMPLCLCHVRGTIPARAGEPLRRSSTAPSGEDYPRTSGGTLPRFARQLRESGLSPHERGNRSTSTSFFLKTRTIPARAGEPQPPPSPRRGLRDYPRTSGGTRIPPPVPHSARGLSPHERGNLFGDVDNGFVSGTIPARAGEPAASSSSSAFSRDYPRTSGGTPCPRWMHARSPGLSPHERGNLTRAWDAALAWGTIPARAGEPGSWRIPSPSVRDYPRTSGGTLSATSLVALH